MTSEKVILFWDPAGLYWYYCTATGIPVPQTHRDEHQTLGNLSSVQDFRWASRLNQPQDLLGTTPTTSVGGWWGRVELVWVLGSGALGGHFCVIPSPHA